MKRRLMNLIVSKPKQRIQKAHQMASANNNKSWWYFHVLALSWFGFLLTIDSGKIGNYIQTRVTEPVLFNIRHAMNKNPKIPSNLKIIALDDATFSFIGGPRPELKDLSLMLSNIQKRSPKAIIIDALLSANPGNDLNALTSLRSSAERTYTGAFVAPFDIKYRHPLNLSKTHYQIDRYYTDNEKRQNDNYPNILSKRLGWRAYGPWPSFQDIFNYQGHLSYNSDGTISPFYQLDSKTIIPHIGLYTADDIKIKDDELRINEKKVPLTQEGGVAINYRNPDDLFARTFSMIDAIKRARSGTSENSINPGDIVLILFGFSTGNTDFHEFGPFGQIPGAFIVASMISDIELGTWIKRVEPSSIFIALAAIFGVILGINITSRLFWLLASTVVVMGLVIAGWAFVYGNTVIPWFLPILSFLGTSLIYFANAQLEAEMQYLRLEKSYYLEKNLRIEKEHEKLKLEGYLSLGKTVQKLLLPPRLSGYFGNYKYTMYYNPCLKMAGDWLYLWKDNEGQLRIFIGDVVGKGPSAAIPVASIITILQDCQELNLSVDESFQTLNQRLIKLYSGLVTTTAQAVVLSPDHDCRLYNAGSSGWFHKTQSETLAWNMRSTPLGLLNDINIAIKKIDFSKDQSILFSFTDGYIESSRELRRFKRNLDMLDNNDISTESLHQLLIDSQHNSDTKDDQTLILIEYRATQTIKNVI